MFTMISPAAFAAAPNTKSPERQAELKAELATIVHNNASIITNNPQLKNFILGFITEDMVKGLVEDYLLANLDIGALGSLAGPALGNLVNGFLAQQGITLPDSINIDNIIGQVLGNDIVNQILTSDFVRDVISKTIMNVLDSIDITELMGELADEYFQGIEEKIVNSIWNNGNPNGVNWDNAKEEWKSTGISISMGTWLAFNLRSLFTFDASSFDLSRLFSLDVLLPALTKAFVDTATEYAHAYIEQVKANIQANARALIIRELNGCLGTQIPLNATNAQIEAAVASVAHNIVCAKAERLICVLQLLQKLTACVCPEISDCIDRVIGRIAGSCIVAPPIIEVTWNYVVTGFNMAATPTTATVTVYITENKCENGALSNSVKHTVKVPGINTKGGDTLIASGVGESLFSVYANMKGFPAIYTVADFSVK